MRVHIFKIQNNYWRSVGTVLGGMMTAQAIPIVGSLIIARIYIPAEFGVYSIWLGAVSIVSVVITGRLEHALGIEDIGDARNTMTISVAILTIFACFLVGIVLFAALYFQRQWFATMSLTMIFAIIPTAQFLAISQLWQSLAACDGKFRELSIIRIVQASFVTIAQIIAGILKASATSLSFSYGVGTLIGVGVCFYVLPLSGVYPRTFGEALLNVRQMLVRYKKFPQFALPADGISTLSGYLPLFILSSRFSDEVAGWTALALRVFGAPIALLGGAVRDVFKNSSSEAFKERGECRGEYLHTFKILLICSLIAVPLFMLSSEWFFVVAFGENWRQAGVICSWLAPMFTMRCIASPLSYTMYLAEKQNYDFVWQVALLITTVIAFVFSSTYKHALINYSTGYSLLYGAYCMMSYKFSKGDNL
jgi:O-antigen/teichoic acid export membrane protein